MSKKQKRSRSSKPARSSPSPKAEQRPDGRGSDGRFRVGNTARLIHGARSRRVMNASLPDMADYRDVLREKEAALVADLGGESNLTVTKRELTTRFIEATAILTFLGGNILKFGVLTTKGKTRAAVATYLQVLDRVTRLALTLGLERQAKQVPSIEDFIRQRQQPQEQEPAS